MYKLYSLNTDDISLDTAFDISSVRRSKMESYQFEKDKKLSLGASILLDQMLKKHDLREKDMIYGFTQYGKPYLKGYEKIHFNLSHSEKMCILVESDKEVGCDIERIQKDDVDIVNRCFSEEEKRNLEKSSDKDRLFTQIWTAKEAFLKCIGTGLSEKMKDITITHNENIRVKQSVNQKLYSFHSAKIEDYVLTICEEES
jgi:4'-phosphopantetheinyl transferase